MAVSAAGGAEVVVGVVERPRVVLLQGASVVIGLLSVNASTAGD